MPAYFAPRVGPFRYVKRIGGGPRVSTAERLATIRATHAGIRENVAEAHRANTALRATWAQQPTWIRATLTVVAILGALLLLLLLFAG